MQCIPAQVLLDLSTDYPKLHNYKCIISNIYLNYSLKHNNQLVTSFINSIQKYVFDISLHQFIAESCIFIKNLFMPQST